MPEIEQVEAIINEFAEYHDRMGYSEQEIVEKSENDEEIRGYTAMEDSGTEVAVKASNKRPLVSFSYRYQLHTDIAGRIDEETAERYVEEDEEEEDEEEDEEIPVRTQAALNLLGEIDEEQQKNIHYQLFDIITRPGVWSEVHEYEGAVTGFEVRKRVYPYESEFTIGDYEEAFSQMIAPGRRGHMFLLYTLNLRDSEDSIGKLEELTSINSED